MKKSIKNNWLDNPIVSKYYDFEEYEIYENHYKDVNYYYPINDPEKNIFGQKENLEYSQSYDNFDTKINIQPNTPRYHCNLLFRKMIDHVINYNFFYKIQQAGTLINEDDSCENNYLELLNPNLKYMFYDFCNKNTF